MLVQERAALEPSDQPVLPRPNNMAKKSAVYQQPDRHPDQMMPTRQKSACTATPETSAGPSNEISEEIPWQGGQDGYFRLKICHESHFLHLICHESHSLQLSAENHET